MTHYYAIDKKTNNQIVLTPAERLYADLFNTNDISEIPTHVNETMPYVLDKCIDEKYAKILKKYYYDELTFEQISRQYDIPVTREAVRTKKEKAIRLLHRPPASNYLKYGKDYMKMIEKEREKISDKRLEKIKAIIFSEITTTAAEKLAEIVLALQDKTDKESVQTVEIIDKATSLMLSVDTLDLSPRALNCLRRAGIKTIRDLTAYTPTEIANVKNLGDKSLKEITQALDNINLSLKNEFDNIDDIPVPNKNEKTEPETISLINVKHIDGTIIDIEPAMMDHTFIANAIKVTFEIKEKAKRKYLTKLLAISDENFMAAVTIQINKRDPNELTLVIKETDPCCYSNTIVYTLRNNGPKTEETIKALADAIDIEICASYLQSYFMSHLNKYEYNLAYNKLILNALAYDFANKCREKAGYDAEHKNTYTPISKYICKELLPDILNEHADLIRPYLKTE